MYVRIGSAVAILVLLAACGDQQASPRPETDDTRDVQGHSAPTSFTVEANAAVARALPLDDPLDFEDARRGLIASEEVLIAGPGDRGRPIWDTNDYAFLEGEAPASVNPSLWRQARLNSIHGLFEVVEGVYQVRGFDLSNLTLIRGATGWIAVDPLTSRETAAAALAFARRHLGDAPIVALILTHSHVDHFGGVAALLPEDPAERAAMRIVAPRGFIEAATSENVLAGVAMGRRAAYMYGAPLERSPRGHVDTGLGKAPALGTLGLAEPTDLVDHTPQPMAIDGVDFVFQYAPDSEAPAELAFHLPAKRAYCSAELANHTMHNLYTLRGAKVRDALLWSGYLDDALERFGDSEVVFASHQWPVWGNERVRNHLARHRDVYKYLHDQTLRMANAGATPREIAEQIELPAELTNYFAIRGYYGTARHNAKAVYQNYFGWYDANPANLDPLPPEAEARHYVEAMGGSVEVLRKAHEAYQRGEYRWVATLLDHAVFADPKNDDARSLLADTYDQLGYQAEAAPWRDAYLTGAHELRHGITAPATDLANATGVLQHLPPGDFFAAMAARVDGPKAAGKSMTLNFTFTDLGETWVLSLENGVLHARSRDADPHAAASVRLTHDFLVKLATRQAGLREMLFSDDLAVEGSRIELLSFFSLLDSPDGRFPIVTP